MWCNWSQQAAANDNNFTRAGMSVEEAAPYWGTGVSNAHISYIAVFWHTAIQHNKGSQGHYNQTPQLVVRHENTQSMLL